MKNFIGIYIHLDEKAPLNPFAKKGSRGQDHVAFVKRFVVFLLL